MSITENQDGEQPNEAAAVLTPSQALNMRVKAAQRAHDDERDFAKAANDAAVKSGEESIKAAILINGGASVAMLAFIGTLVSQGIVKPEQIPIVTKPLIFFGAGVASAFAAGALAYLVNLSIVSISAFSERQYEHPFVRRTPRSNKYWWCAEVLRWLAIIAVCTSISLFVGGLLAAKDAFDKTATFQAKAAATPTP